MLYLMNCIEVNLKNNVNPRERGHDDATTTRRNQTFILFYIFAGHLNPTQTSLTFYGRSRFYLNHDFFRLSYECAMIIELGKNFWFVRNKKQSFPT